MQDHYDPLAAYQTTSPVESAFAWLGKPQVRFGILSVLLLCGAVALLYGHSSHYPFVFDDRPFFTEINLRHYGESLFHFDLRWFAYASFGWTYQLYGMDIPALRWGNILLHGLTAGVLFVLFARLLQLTAVAPDSKSAGYTAFLLALAFAVHPVAVYGVAYLVERSIIMATLFGAASLLCYLEGISRERGKAWLGGAVAFYFLAVFSKEHSVMLPAVAALISLMLRTPLRDIRPQDLGGISGICCRRHLHRAAHQRRAGFPLRDLRAKHAGANVGKQWRRHARACLPTQRHLAKLSVFQIPAVMAASQSWLDGNRPAPAFPRTDSELARICRFHRVYPLSSCRFLAAASGWPPRAGRFRAARAVAAVFHRAGQRTPAGTLRAVPQLSVDGHAAVTDRGCIRQPRQITASSSPCSQHARCWHSSPGAASPRSPTRSPCGPMPSTRTPTPR
jgi:hypothetical protein